ncbi:hypothetical protein SAMN04488239_101105 [Ruegeria marina]|uniref:Uncharacterized protein n=2 Tax=Ruegeria marina TaxID=639004 RepID=A0A1G6IF13_9RHOB|nr:hypothetical protein SAMN04488239_101105 [Ruegeria marina]
MVERATEAESRAAEAAGEVATATADDALQAVDNGFSAAIGETSAALDSARDLIDRWESEGMLTQSGFDYDTMVAALEDSALNDTLRTGILGILEDIKAAPETLAVQAQALRALISN